jgi:uncharacterized membrane protein
MTMRKTSHDIGEDYLRRLDRELHDLPKIRRREVVDEIAAHISAARADLAAGDEAGLRNVLERLGTPEDIAADARERFDVRPRGGKTRDVAAIVLLLVGGFLFLVGWFVGLVLLWASEAWTTRDKLIGTFVVPGGLLLSLGVGLAAAWAGESCSGVLDENGTSISRTCESASSVHQGVLFLLIAAIVVAPVFTSVYLARRMRRRVDPAASF